MKTKAKAKTPKAIPYENWEELRDQLLDAAEDIFEGLPPPTRRAADKLDLYGQLADAIDGVVLGDARPGPRARR